MDDIFDFSDVILASDTSKSACVTVNGSKMTSSISYDTGAFEIDEVIKGAFDTKPLGELVKKAKELLAALPDNELEEDEEGDDE